MLFCRSFWKTDAHRSFQFGERIEQLHAGFLEVAGVAGHHSQLVPLRSGGELAIEGGNADAVAFPLCFELAPNMGGTGIEAEDAAFHAIAERHEPGAELGLAFAVGKAFDAATDFADGDGADVEFALVLAEPRDDFRVQAWAWPVR